MQDQINRAFAALNAKLLERQLAWFEGRNEAVRAYYASEERKAALGNWAKQTRKESEDIHKADKEKLENLAGGKTWLSAIWGCSNQEQRAELITKNVAGLIARRDAQIIKALTAKGITSIPEFDLVEMSDGCEGTFFVAGHKVTIRTILAGGYNIQCLHQRTLVKVS